MTRAQFEALLDRLYPSNKFLRNLRSHPLPTRTTLVACHLFLNPEVGTDLERDQVRCLLRVLEDSGTFDFDETENTNNPDA